MDFLTAGTFLLFTGLVAGLTYYFTRGKELGTGEGYFLAGRSLTGGVIAGSLLLTNLSTEQLVGLNGGAFDEGLSVFAWEVIAAFSMVLMALVFLPKYLARGVATVPQFLEGSFGPKTRAVSTLMFVLADSLITLPVVLYTGATAIIGVLGLDVMTGLGDDPLAANFEAEKATLLWGLVIALGVVGSCYAVFGGLRAVAFSDVINGIGLLIGGLLIAYLSLQAVAEKSPTADNVVEAFQEMKETRSDLYESLQEDYRAVGPLKDARKALQDRRKEWDALNAEERTGVEPTASVGLTESLAYLKAEDAEAYAKITPTVREKAEEVGIDAPADADPLELAKELRTQSPPVEYERLSRRTLKDPTIPWSTLLSGVLLVNLFYWCTNQQIIQRTLAADGLANGQKGVLLAAGFKLLAPIVMVIPGLAALHLYGSDLVGGGKVTKGIEAYGVLVADVLPRWLLGFFAAVVFGAILSTFNSVLNSTATLFSLGVYKAQINPEATEAQQVRVGQIFGALVAVTAVIGGPLLGGVEGIFDFLQQMRGLYFIPIFAVTLWAFNSRRLPDWAGAVSILGGATAVGMKYWVPGWNDAVDSVMHNWHFIGCVFTALVIFLAVVLKVAPVPAKPELPPSPVDMTPWKWAVPAGVLLVLGVLGLYLAFL
ncbi:sodium:solute symporter family transporter [Alienimonas chondri]|uniref:Solute:Na+ symporter, SSS family n=1 Tax=Alienimonas chondri TaxID=2681879 RepID=A0ABX1VFG1_9PLAN|nr:hypothetical protein [Alienimonas chondri]NNJ26844.1 hypothetical protein [Alienimonas chondri]